MGNYTICADFGENFRVFSLKEKEIEGGSEVNYLMFEDIYLKFFINLIDYLESIFISKKEEIDLSFLQIFIRV
jgi:hypothetical protein